jgi:hypothetical protein
MYTTSYVPWENCPKKLYHHEVIDPFSVLIDFFGIDDLNGHRTKLKKWRYFVNKNEAYKDERFGPGSLLFIYDQNIRLLEAAFLLEYKDSITRDKKSILSVADLETERKRLDDFPDNLSDKELHNPYSAIRKVFSEASLQRHRDYLHEWLYGALYIKGGCDDLEEFEMKLIYKNMMKLYAAAWLIYNRENKAIDK